MNLLHVFYSGFQWRLTRPLHHGSRVCDGSAGSLRNWYKPFTSEDSVSCSYVFLCHSAAMLKVRRWFKLGAVPDPVSLWIMGACLLLFTLYGWYWQDSFSHIQNPSRASSFFFSFFCLSLPLCQRVFHQHMHWCTTEWGHRRWSSNLLSAPCSPPSTTQAPDLLSCGLWTQKQLVRRCCVCAHVCSLYFSLLCYMWCNRGQ